MTTSVVFDGSALSIAQVAAVARKQARPVLAEHPEFVQRINSGAEFLERLLREDGVIYGVTTGYGDSCSVPVSSELAYELPRHLYTFHGCGLGEVFSEEQSRAILVARLASLCQGFSGVRYALLQRICLLLQQDLIPVIPSEGSVGASGDLTPLSYLAAVLEGHREVWVDGERHNTAEVYSEVGLTPITLQPKEALAIMNGTAAMTGLACLALDRSYYAAQLAARVTSYCSLAIQGNHFHFDPVLFSVKAHPGQQLVAQWIHSDLQAGEAPRNSPRLQDRYSLRCAPHVIGVLLDTLDWAKQVTERELNSANDNPIIDAVGEHVLHGGHFYGGHIAQVMDAVKTVLANIADLADRQVAQTVDPKFNHNLPANLSGAEGPGRALNHGFKAVQIAVSAWTAEALKLTMPASVFSRSTECHNQDKVSMGTIAARDCVRILELLEQVLAAALAVGWQGVKLRLRTAELTLEQLAPSMQESLHSTEAVFELVVEDRPLEADLRSLVERIRQNYWKLYD